MLFLHVKVKFSDCIHCFRSWFLWSILVTFGDVFAWVNFWPCCLAPFFCSSAFYSSKYGYKMCLRLYLNGDGTGRGTHLSLFFVVMRGKYDALLKWPFSQKVNELIRSHSSFRRSFTLTLNF